MSWWRRLELKEVVTIFLTIASVFAAYLAIHEGRRRMELEQRAWVLASEAVKAEHLPTAKAGKVPYMVRIGNFGKTPATDMRIRAEPFFFPSLIPPKDADSRAQFRDVDSVSVLPSGSSGTHGVVVYWLDKDFEAVKATAPRDAPLYFFIVGRVEYRDVFGKERSTLFCFRKEATPEGLLSFAPDLNHVK